MAWFKNPQSGQLFEANTADAMRYAIQAGGQVQSGEGVEVTGEGIKIEDKHSIIILSKDGKVLKSVKKDVVETIDDEENDDSKPPENQGLDDLGLGARPSKSNE